MKPPVSFLSVVEFRSSQFFEFPIKAGEEKDLVLDEVEIPMHTYPLPAITVRMLV
ncbi:MAG: hypothetical protein QXR87_07290 [Candidatus Hadarchaeales archaeon]